MILLPEIFVIILLVDRCENTLFIYDYSTQFMHLSEMGLKMSALFKPLKTDTTFKFTFHSAFVLQMPD